MDGLAWHGSIVKRVVPVTPTSHSKEFVMVASTSKSPDTEINTDAPLTERSVAAAHEAIDNLSARMARTEKSRSEERRVWQEGRRWCVKYSYYHGTMYLLLICVCF